MNVKVVVKSVDKKNFVDLKKISKKCNPGQLNVNINNVREDKDKGFVSITCECEKDADVLKNELTKKLGPTCEVNKTNLRSPKIKIVGIQDSCDGDYLQKVIIDRNGLGEDDLKIVYLRQNQKNKTTTAYAEVSPVAFQSIMAYGRVRLEWQACKVYEDFNINRCFKCSGYNHSAKNCSRQSCCSKCSSTEHDVNDCEEDFKKCVNCLRENEVYHKSYDTGHCAYDFVNCGAYKNFLEYTKSITRYD